MCFFKELGFLFVFLMLCLFHLFLIFCSFLHYFLLSVFCLLCWPFYYLLYYETFWGWSQRNEES